MSMSENYQGDEGPARIRVEAVCDGCGIDIVVPFKPIEGRAVLCRDCLSAKRTKKAASSVDNVAGRFDITCSHCGKPDTVPFKPYEHSAVLCTECLANPNIMRMGGKILHAIICSSCGREARVPFKPDAGSRVLCKHCHNEEREQKAKDRERFAQRHPTDVHGTKVRIDVVCDRCGAQDTLNYVPKTSGAILCRQCAESTFGDEWAQRHHLSAKEFPFTCVKCSAQDFVPFKPKPDHQLMCKHCLNEQAVLQNTKEGAKPLDTFLYVRRK